MKVSEDTEYELKIPGVSLVADMGENGPIAEVPVPAMDGTEDVDISFFAGKDTYHIGKVERRKKESQDDDGKNKVSTEVILYVEPETLEKDTELLSINASWGELKSQGRTDHIFIERKHISTCNVCGWRIRRSSAGADAYILRRRDDSGDCGGQDRQSRKSMESGISL